jgi:hypothetical protein
LRFYDDCGLLPSAAVDGNSDNRYYDPSTGQFLTVDPMVGETGEAYAYTGTTR